MYSILFSLIFDLTVMANHPLLKSISSM